MKRLENFYRANLSVACNSETGKIYVGILPSLSSGYLVINPSDSVKREIIEYNGKGTDETGNYINTIRRGVGNTTAQTHGIGEVVRGNLVAEHWDEMKEEVDASVKNTGNEEIDGVKTFVRYPKKKGDYEEPEDDLEFAPKKYVDDVALAAAPNASSTIKGVSKLSVNPEEQTNPIAVGDNDPRMPTANEKAAMAGTSGTPSGSNKYVTNDDTSSTSTANKVARYDSDGNLDATNLYQKFTYGEDISVNDALYLNPSDGKVYKTSASYVDERIQNFVGFAKESGNENDIKKVQIAGIVSGFSGLTTGADYYLANTAGTISATQGTFYYLIGKAINTTRISIVKDAKPRFGSLISRNLDTVYQAPSDGFVTVHAANLSNANATFSCYSDDSNPPTTLIFKDVLYVYNPYVNIMFPVKSGNYWKVVLEHTSGTYTVSIYWLPLLK